MAMTRNELLEAIRKAVSLEFEHVPKNDSEIEHTFSLPFMKRMAKLFRKQEKAYWKYVNTAGKRVAVAILAAALLFATACSFKPIREPVIKFFTEVYETFTTCFFEGDDGKKAIEKEYVLEPVPEGFTEVSKSSDDATVVTNYENQNGARIRITQILANGVKLNLDTEKEGVRREVIEGIEVVISEFENRKQLVYTVDQYYIQVSLTGDFDDQLIRQIIRNLK